MTRSHNQSWRGLLAWASVAAVAALVLLPPLFFLQWRQARLAELSRPAVQAGWDAFRDDMRAQSDRDGPVQRKVPKSAEPPELVWLRDYATLAIAAWVLFVGVIGIFFVVLVRGAVQGGATAVSGPGSPGP